MESLIDPKDIIELRSVEELCTTANHYFQSLADPTPWMIKPFASWIETPEMLQTVGVLLSGLHLGKTMTVLDFGAGSCWLSRILSQLQCRVIACDVSAAALEIGKQLYARLPPLGEHTFEPTFLQFDGYHIALPDESVDRIVCNDAFHHVPNCRDVLAEFGRVLRPGGVVGFSEAGRNHSQSAQSQQEMRNYAVLENDIDVTAIFAIARPHGLDRLHCKWMLNHDVSLENNEILLGSPASQLPPAVTSSLMSELRQTMMGRSLFYLSKGKLCTDSRCHEGLSHEIEIEKKEYVTQCGKTLIVPVTITNTGGALWLVSNVNGIGVVKVGCHLYSDSFQLRALDFARHELEAPVRPGCSVALLVPLQFTEPGSFIVGIDLVSEAICWFETLGSKPLYLNVTVYPRSTTA